MRRHLAREPLNAAILTSAQETLMAKGMNRGNREPKKPKSKKPAAGPTVSLLSPKGMSAQPALPKKKS
jgi:hypothetical protein